MCFRRFPGIGCGVIVALTAQVLLAQPAGTAFTYQGQLKDGGVPANGLYDLRFSLQALDGHPIGVNLNFAEEPIFNGLFSVVLDFGANSFDGEMRFLEISVRLSGSGDPFTVLAPRQELTPAPYASTAMRTVGLDGHSLDAADGDPLDAVFVTSNGKVSMSRGGLDVYDDVGHGITFTSSRFTFDEYPSEDTVYSYNNVTQTHRFFTDGTSRLEIDPLGNVGIGVSAPHNRLEVAGTAAMEGFRLLSDPGAGYVLTSDTFGNGTWQEPAVSEYLWQKNGSHIYYNSGNVGFGLVTSPAHPLHGSTNGSAAAIGAYNTYAGPGGNAITAESHGASSNVIFARNNATTGTSHGIYGLIYSPDGDGVRGRNQATTGSAVGVRGMTNSITGIAVHGQALSDTGTTYGLYGEVDSPDGYAGYFEGRGYFSGSVGIGTTTPGSPLTVSGMIESTTGGFKFPDGTMQTSAAIAGESPWAEAPSGIFYPDGNIGFGLVTNPSTPLQGISNTGASTIDVHNTHTGPGGNAITADTDGADGYAVFGRNNATTGGSHGVYGLAKSPAADGVRGRNLAATGSAVGVRGITASTDGIAVYGQSLADTGTNYGIYGQVDSPDGFAGYFDGRGYFSGYVGIGTVPNAELDVAGTVQMTGLKLGSGTTAGHVLTTDENGIGTWQTPIWTKSGNEIHYADGDVGVGVVDPLTTLHVAGGNEVYPGPGDIYVGDPSNFGLKIGVLLSGPDAGACKIMTSGIGSTLNLGSIGEDELIVLKNSKVGILTNDPQSTLDVNGTMRTTGFKLTTSPTEGYVLTSDASGNATWQEPTGVGFLLPYEGTVNAHDQAALSISNTAPGSGGDPGTNTVAGFFESAALGGSAVKAHTDGGLARSVHAEADGSVGIAVYALANGTNGRAVAAANDSAQPTIEASNSGTGDIFQGRQGGVTVFRVTHDGTTITNVLQIEGGSDLSEKFDVRALDTKPEPGMVVSIDPEHPGELMVSAQAYDRTVAGIISGAGGVKPGMLMGQQGSLADGRLPIALSGRVYVRAVATNGCIQPGDLLTTSNVSGHAMRVTDHAKAQGAIIGKAMTSLERGEGLVLVLVSLQ